MHSTRTFHRGTYQPLRNETACSEHSIAAVTFDQDLRSGSWIVDVSAVTNMSNMFNNITLSTANYDSILTGWEALAVQNNVSFHGGSSTYSTGAPATARANLIADHTWTITDGGPA
jgi:hypothetical protein